MLNLVMFGLFLFSFIATLILFYLDHRKKRSVTREPFISFLVPVYNGAETIEATIRSIFSSYTKGRFEVIVADSKSTDKTREVLNELKKELNFKIVLHEKRIKKAESLNIIFKKTKGEVIFIIDADILLRRKNIDSLLARLEDEKVGASSCRYKPINRGIIPSLMEVEYGMSTFSQTAQNHFSTTALWGGCIAVKSKVLSAVGGFSEDVLPEDLDLALKVGENGWRVEESPIPVLTYVPDNLRSWYRQKVRWGAAFSENFLKHSRAYLEHPIMLFFTFTYSVLAITFVISMINNIIFMKNLIILFDAFREQGYSFLTSVGLAKVGSGFNFFSTLGIYFLYPLFSLPYAIINIRRKSEIYKVLWIFPFAIIYYPVFSVVSLIGIYQGAKRYISMKRKGYSDYTHVNNH